MDTSPIHIVDEDTHFVECASIEDFLTDDLRGGKKFRQIAARLESGLEYDRYVEGRAHGFPIPEWIQPGGSRYHGNLDLYRTGSVYIATRFGAICESSGALLEASVDEARYFTPDFRALPFVSINPSDDSQLTLDFASAGQRLGRCSVFLTWGGVFNYGHFILDCISSLIALKEAGLLKHFPALLPSGLKPWHEDLVIAAVGEECVVRVDSDVVFASEIVYASPMAHFLHKPNSLLKLVRNALLPNDFVRKDKMIYISRANDRKRFLTNERELEQGLALLGFDIVRPELMSVSDQIRLFYESSFIVGATGAAFANCIFAREGTVVLEIQPSNFMGRWVPLLCSEVDLDWHIFFAQSPISSETVDIGGVKHSNIEFTWQLDIGAVLGVIARKVSATQGVFQ